MKSRLQTREGVGAYREEALVDSVGFTHIDEF